MQLKSFYTINEIADLLSVDKQMIRKACVSGELHYYQMVKNGKIIISSDDFQEWMLEKRK